jgi:hypothetical protein
MGYQYAHFGVTFDTMDVKVTQAVEFNLNDRN